MRHGLSRLLHAFTLGSPLRLAVPVQLHSLFHFEERRIQVAVQRRGWEEVYPFGRRHVPVDRPAADDRSCVDVPFDERMLAYDHRATRTAGNEHRTADSHRHYDV